MKKALQAWIGVSFTCTMLLGGIASAAASNTSDAALRAAVEGMNGTLGWAAETQQITGRWRQQGNAEARLHRRYH